MKRKINITCPDDDLSYDDSSFDRLYIYRSIMSLLNDVKISQGPQAVIASLRRHPVIFDYLHSVQKDSIISLEGKIKLLGDTSS